MNALLGLLLFLAGIPGDEKAPSPLGEKVVQMREAAFYRGASRLSGVVRKAEYGETVNVTAVEGRFSRVAFADGSEAFLLSSALLPREKFVPAPANEEEKMRLKAQGYEAGRFDAETEKKYREEKGKDMDRAYTQLDGLESRRIPRAELERRLRDFRREGKLGEFSNVK